MIDERERFERAFDVFGMPEPALERMRARRDRKDRNKRLAAGALGVVVAGSLFGMLVAGLRGNVGNTGDRTSPQPSVGRDRGYHSMGLAFSYSGRWGVAGSRIKELVLSGPGRQLLVVMEEPWAPNGSSCRPPTLPSCLTLTTDIIDWLRGSPDFATSGPWSVVIDGRAAVALDIDVVSYEAPVPMIVASDWGVVGRGPHTWWLRPSDRARLYFFSEEGTTVVIALTAPREGFEASLREAKTVIDSFDFDAERVDVPAESPG